MRTMASALSSIQSSVSASTCLASTQLQLSYAEVWVQVESLGKQLRALGIRDGIRVAVLSNVTIPHILIITAVSYAGGTLIIFPADSREEFVKETAPFWPCYSIFSRDQSISPQSSEDVEVVAFGIIFVIRQCGLLDDTQCPTDAEAIFLTSGSSGLRLGVVCPQSQVAFCRRAIQQRLNYCSEDRILIGGSLAFDYNFYQLPLAFAVGATIVVCEQSHNALVLAEHILKLRVSILPLIPYTFRLLLRSRMLDRGDYSCVRTLSATGEVWPTQEIADLLHAFPRSKAFPMYGLTECKRVSILDLCNHPELLGSVGHALDGTEIRILDENNESLPANEVGEIAVLGPHIAAGYYGEPEATAAKFRRLSDGTRILHTGDKGYMDNSRALWFVARDTGMIKARGVRISATKIESTLVTCPQVRCAVVTNLLTTSGDKVAIMLDLNQYDDGSKKQVLKWLREHWPAPGMPDYIEYGPIPSLPNGKPARTIIVNDLNDRFNNI